MSTVESSSTLTVAPQEQEQPQPQPQPLLPSGALNRDEEDYWLAKTRTGGAYIPPARLSLLQRNLSTDSSSPAYQRVSWEALKKSITGLVNKANTSNLRFVIKEMFGENLIRGRGVLVRAVMRAQSAALPFTAVYATMMAILNTKIPQVGELLLCRLITQFRKAYRRNDKAQCLAVTMFLAHLVNHRVAHEIIVLEILTLLLESPTEDSVEIGVGFVRECGAFLTEFSPKPTNAIFERFRTILHEGSIDKRVQYMIEVLFQVRKDKFKDHLAIPVDLDLVEEEDQITHYLSLDDDLDPQDILNVFQVDERFEENERQYEELEKEILGGEEVREGEEEEEEEGVSVVEAETANTIADLTGTNLLNLRKTIYLTIMSSADFEECGHKLLKLSLPLGHEHELSNMIVECCSQERTYLKFYGLLGERFCKLNMIWQECFERCFNEVYATIHRLETNRIRNVSKFFGHLLETEAIQWRVFAPIKLTEEDTTSAGRIFLKLLFQDLAEVFGRTELKGILRKEDNGEVLSGVLPATSNDINHIRFAVNFFTAIELPELAEHLHEQLKIHPEEDGDATDIRFKNIRRAHDSDSEGLVSDEEEEEDRGSHKRESHRKVVDGRERDDRRYRSHERGDHGDYRRDSRHRSHHDHRVRRPSERSPVRHRY